MNYQIEFHTYVREEHGGSVNLVPFEYGPVELSFVPSIGMELNFSCKQAFDKIFHVNVDSIEYYHVDGGVFCVFQDTRDVEEGETLEDVCETLKDFGWRKRQ